MALTIVNFIDVDTVKATSYLDENVDDGLIKTVIRQAQDLRIHPTIGTGIYNELVTQISAGTTTALNVTLLDTYIRPALTYWVLFEGLDIFMYRFMNKGVLKRTSENSEIPSTDEIVRLGGKFRDIAEWYTNRVIKYLVENSTSYPLYDNPGNGADIIHPNRNAYSTGWWTGRGVGEDVPQWMKDEWPGTFC